MTDVSEDPIATFEENDKTHRKLFSRTLKQEAETRARYLEEYADIISRELYAGERPSGIWNLEQAARLLRQQAEVIEAYRTTAPPETTHD